MKELIRLNKFISNSGLCSRRDADMYISMGEVKVNDKIINQLGYKIKSGDKVYFNGQELTLSADEISFQDWITLIITCMTIIATKGLKSIILDFGKMFWIGFKIGSVNL